MTYRSTPSASLRYSQKAASIRRWSGIVLVVLGAILLAVTIAAAISSLWIGSDTNILALSLLGLGVLLQADLVVLGIAVLRLSTSVKDDALVVRTWTKKVTLSPADIATVRDKPRFSLDTYDGVVTPSMIYLSEIKTRTGEVVPSVLVADEIRSLMAQARKTSGR